MDELTLLAGREETPSPAWITAAAVTAAFATCVLFFASAVFAQPASNSLGTLHNRQRTHQTQAPVPCNLIESGD
jgi:hypothetical protein